MVRYGKFIDDLSLRKYRQLVTRINDLGSSIATLSDADLQGKTTEFRQRVDRGESLDSLLPEAYAVVREASSRVIGMRHFDVQLLGGAIMHDGGVTEMKTGEGKTLVSTLPAYLNGLGGDGVHVVTVNDYLARRDKEHMGRIHDFLGLTVEVIQQDSNLQTRQIAYNSDITYVTHQQLGFDYLLNLTVMNRKEVRCPSDGYNYAIIDEVDSVLIDECTNPLIISEKKEFESNLSAQNIMAANDVAERLTRGVHYEVLEKEMNVSMKDVGMEAAQALLPDFKALWEVGSSMGGYILNAVRAKELFKRNVQYVVQFGEIKIIDESTGRVKERSRYGTGIHEAIEAKEGLVVQGEGQIIHSITYQEFFGKYKKLAGMTGTATTESEELWETYGLKVSRVPTNKPSIRKDETGIIFRTAAEKWDAIEDKVYTLYEMGQPVLVGTISIMDSEYVSKNLSEIGVPHKLLNAKPEYAQMEAETVAQAGRLGAVTIATNMAGRGTDIVLGGNPFELAKGILREYIKPAFTKEEPKSFSAHSDTFGYELPPNLLGLLAKAYAHVRATCDVALEPEEALHVLSEICSFVRPLFQPSAQESWEAPDDLDGLEVSLLKRGLPEFFLPRNSNGDSNETATFIHVPPKTISKCAVCAYAVYDLCDERCKAEGEMVRRLGGLHVIGTDLHPSRRIDLQLRGRAGRQGDPGRTSFYLSLEDTLLKKFGVGTTGNIFEASFDMLEASGTGPEYGLPMPGLITVVRSSQYEAERWAYHSRKYLFKMGKSFAPHREQVEGLRKYILYADSDGIEDMIRQCILANVSEAVAGHAKTQGRPKNWRAADILRHLSCLCQVDVQSDAVAAEVDAALKDGTWKAKARALSKAASAPKALDELKGRVLRGQARYVADRIAQHLFDVYSMLEDEARGNEAISGGALYDQQYVLLRSIDRVWHAHQGEMNLLKDAMQLRRFPEGDPVQEFKKESSRALVPLMEQIVREIFTKLFVDWVEPVEVQEAMDEDDEEGDELRVVPALHADGEEVGEGDGDGRG